MKEEIIINGFNITFSIVSLILTFLARYWYVSFTLGVGAFLLYKRLQVIEK